MVLETDVGFSGIFISRSLLDFDCLMGTEFHYLCKFRSGIQFLVDDFSDIFFYIMRSKSKKF
jgi:hypothetical protein